MNEERAQKLAFMATKGDAGAARALLAARSNDGYIHLSIDEDGDGQDILFFVCQNGRGGHTAGTQAQINEQNAQDKQEAAARNASPSLQWTSQSGQAIKVWHEYEDQVTVSLNGKKVAGEMQEVPASQRAQAKANGIVAVIATKLGSIGLTAERKSVLQ